MSHNRETILIAEDDHGLRNALKSAVEHLGINVLTAENGQQALELFDKNPIDVILSDINMPEKNGIELLKSIRLKSLDTPFVILTGASEKDYIIEALRLGANDFLEKPIDPSRFKEVVTRMIEVGVRKKRIKMNSPSKTLDEKFLAYLQLYNNELHKKK